jgi:hypothetical protein
MFSGEKLLFLAPFRFAAVPSASLSFSQFQSRPVFLNRRAAARYRALASIIPGSENLSFFVF